MTVGRAVGVLREIHRHPVKSMGGETIEESVVEKRYGVVGDRAWAIRDIEAGEIRGAKKIPALMMLRARYVAPPQSPGSAPIAIDLGGGLWIRSDDPMVSVRISERLGRPVVLESRPPASDRAHYRRARPIVDQDAEVREAYELLPDEPTPTFADAPVDFSALAEYVSPPGTYFDFFDLHLISRQSMASFAAAVPDSKIEARRFRANFVVDLDFADALPTAEPGSAWPEQERLGRTLAIGDARFEVTMPMARCGMTTHAQPDLAKDPRIMRALYKVCSLNLGVALTVLRPGRVRVGDAIRLADG